MHNYSSLGQIPALYARHITRSLISDADVELKGDFQPQCQLLSCLGNAIHALSSVLACGGKVPAKLPAPFCGWTQGRTLAPDKRDTPSHELQALLRFTPQLSATADSFTSTGTESYM